MNLKEAFKFPLKADKYGSYIWDDKDHMVANFLIDDEENQKNLVEITNGRREPKNRETTTYENGEIIYNDIPILLIRGWGYLTGIGGLNLPEGTAADIQEELANLII